MHKSSASDTPHIAYVGTGILVRKEDLHGFRATLETVLHRAEIKDLGKRFAILSNERVPVEVMTDG